MVNILYYHTQVGGGCQYMIGGFLRKIARELLFTPVSERLIAFDMSRGGRCGRGMSQQDALSLRCLGRDVADARLEKTSPSTDVPLGSFM